jgi:uncharacterized protein YyaL (SSP411 family)
MLLALEEYLEPPQVVVIRGEPAVTQPWLARSHARYAPRRLAMAIPADSGDLPGLLAERTAREPSVAYVCQGHTCLAPVTTLADLEEALGDCEIPAPPA